MAVPFVAADATIAVVVDGSHGRGPAGDRAASLTRYHARFLRTNARHAVQVQPIAGFAIAVLMPMRLLLAAWLLVLGACASAPPAQPFDPARAAAALDARRLDDSDVLAALRRAGIAAPADGQGWTLDALTVAAWQLRPELAQARAGRSAADAEVVMTTRRANPVLAFTPEWIVNAPAGVSNWIAAVLVSQVFENPDKRNARTEQARARLRQAQWQQAQSAWELRAQVRASALEWQLAEPTARLARREHALRRRWLQLIEQRVSAGLLPAAERERARLLTLQDETQAQAARQAVRAARAQLAAALGVGAAALADVALQLPALDAVDAWQAPAAADLREATLFNRVDLALSPCASWPISVCARACWRCRGWRG